MDSIRAEASANVAGIEAAFEAPLPDMHAAPHLWTTRGNARMFNGLAHNIERVLGADWKQTWLELTTRRLRRCRINTIANGSDRELHGYCTVPYVFTMTGCRMRRSMRQTVALSRNNGARSVTTGM